MKPADSPASPFQPLWSQTLASGPRGLALAREKNWVLAWDQHHWLYLFNQTGQRQSQMHFPGSLVSVATADDGSGYAAIGAQGEVLWLAPDFTIRWQKTLPQPLLALAVDPFGQYLAVADNRGSVQILDCLGRPVTSLQTPRPVHHLAFVPAAPWIVASADYGLVGGFDLAGNWKWRDGLVVHVGALAVTGDGAQNLFACFSDGIRRYDAAGKPLPAFTIGESCRLVEVSFDGQRVLAAGLANRLVLLDSQGQTLQSYSCDQPIAAIQLSPLGDFAVLALVDGPLQYVVLGS